MDTDKTIKVSASNIKLAFWLVTILFFMWGVSYGLIDVMNKNFQNQLGITKATSGLLQAAYFGGYFVIATPAALVARKFGFKGGIIMGLALYAIGALLIIPASNAHSFNMFLGAFFILACGLGSLETNANPYITKLGSDKDAAFRINIAQIDGITTNFSGDYPTLIVHNLDQPGHVAEVTSMLSHKCVNIAAMQLYRSSRGGYAVMVVECDQEIPRDGIEWLKRVEGIEKVTYLGIE